ncbi:MAG: hypothetical protein MUF21_09530, partial [Gemmatimonadaceae bacterium]|nr:hypothetical protein [Gemmatimonadaceae bacterium]
PLYFIDGFPTGADLLDMPIGDVGGVELYRGASEVPAEFLRDGASCGVIAISSWVPPRPRKP